MQIQTKSLLAKLLATENISVEVNAELPTAAFDPTKRIMYLPKWKDMPMAMQDLLIGHEVGHAFDTPAQGWHDAVCDDISLKGYLNVIEDARIERKIKTRYPGLVRSFYAGYRELFDRDFFGVKDVDVNKLPLIDRINLHFKVGSFLNVRFTDSEQALVDRCANTQTWEDVEALAREIHGEAQRTAEEDVEQLMDEFSPTFGEDDSEADMTGDFSSWEKEESEETSENEGGSATGDADEDSDSDDSSDEDSEDDEKSVSDITEASKAVQDFVDNGGVGSITDAAFRSNEKSLIDDSLSKESVYVNIPTNIDLSEIIIDPKEIYNWSKIDTGSAMPAKTLGNKLYAEFIAKNNKTINQMVSTFEMKRKASQFIKAKVSKTGDLNEDRLWAYKTSEDLFKQVTTVPEGKNHGFIMYLDMSGSMARNMSGTIDQLINLTMFARKINVPFEVYGFTGIDIKSRGKITAKVGDYVIRDLNICKLLSSDFSKLQTEEAYKYLLLWKASFDYRRSPYSKDLPAVYMNNVALCMGSTPLNATLVVAIEIAKQFRKATKVEILNTIILTDGEATDNVSFWSTHSDPTSGRDVFSVRDLHYYRQQPVLKYGSAVYSQNKSNDAHRNTVLTVQLLEMYKDITGSKVINYHLLERFTKRSIELCREYSTVGNVEMTQIAWNAITDAQKSSGLVEVKDKYGFDVRYILNGGNLSIEEEDLEVKSNSKSDLLRGFKKFTSTKAQSRVFVQKFIPIVAAA